MKMNIIITRALMRYHNDFFKMSDEERDIFKLQDHDELDKQVVEYVRKELDYSDIEENDRDQEKQFEYNKIMLHYKGIGKNYFMLNEFSSGEDMIKFNNLYDYNVNYHNWQEEAEEKGCVDNDSEFKPTTLHNRYASWARVEIDGNFSYLNLLSLQMWMSWEVEAELNDWIDKEIPHKYVPSKDHGKKVEKGFSWDMHVDANGLEGWYEQLTDVKYKLLSKVYDECEYIGDVVFVKDVSNQFFDKFDPSLNYIFGSMDILKEVNFSTFIEDCDKVAGNLADLMKYRDDYVEKCIAEITISLQEIKKTPPNVVKLKKKKKIVMTDEALDDLDNL